MALTGRGDFFKLPVRRKQPNRGKTNFHRARGGSNDSNPEKANLYDKTETCASRLALDLDRREWLRMARAGGGSGAENSYRLFEPNIGNRVRPFNLAYLARFC